MLLNDKQIPHEILFGLLDETKKQNQKYEHTGIERKEILKKARGTGYIVLMFILLYLLLVEHRRRRWMIEVK